MSAVKDAIGLSRSHLGLFLISKKPFPDIEVPPVNVDEYDPIDVKLRPNGRRCNGLGLKGCCCCCEVSHSGEASSTGDITNCCCLLLSWARGEASIVSMGCMQSRGGTEMSVGDKQDADNGEEGDGEQDVGGERWWS